MPNPNLPTRAEREAKKRRLEGNVGQVMELIGSNLMAENGATMNEEALVMRDGDTPIPYESADMGTGEGYQPGAERPLTSVGVPDRPTYGMGKDYDKGRIIRAIGGGLRGNYGGYAELGSGTPADSMNGGLAENDYKAYRDHALGIERAGVVGGIQNKLAMEQQAALDNYKLSKMAELKFAETHNGFTKETHPEVFARWTQTPGVLEDVNRSKMDADIAANRASVGKDSEAERLRRLTEGDRVQLGVKQGRAALQNFPLENQAKVSGLKAYPLEKYLGLQRDSRTNLPDGSMLQTDLQDGTLSRIQFPSEEENAMRALDDLPPLGMRSSPFTTKPGIKLSSGLEIPAKDTGSQQLFNNIVGHNLGQSSFSPNPAPSTPRLGNSQGGMPSRSNMLGNIGGAMNPDVTPTQYTVAPTQVTNQLPLPVEEEPYSNWWKLKQDMQQVPVLNSIIKNWTNAYGR